MQNHPNRTFVGSVLFLDIVEYSKKSVMEQLKIKQRFNAMLTRSIEHIPPRDRIILDTGDGAAVSFLGNPEEALFVAAALRDAIAGANEDGQLAVRFGINLGPLRLVKDINGQMNMIGDGINVAQRVMSFADPGQILASRSYYEVVSCLSEDYAQLFNYEGSRTDKHVREHEVYAIGAAGSAVRSALAAPSDAGHAAPPIKTRKLMAAASLILVVIVGTSFMLRTLMQSRDHQAAASKESLQASVSPAASGSMRPIGSDSPDNVRPAQSPASSDGQKSPGVNSGPAATAHVTLTVLPWGDVYIDGRSRGASPPLRRLEIDAGPHIVEIRNAGFPTYSTKVSAKAGEEIRIQHRFR